MDFSRFTERQLQALHRVAKTRARAFFKHPRMMIELRKALEVYGELDKMLDRKGRARQ